jgi:hypothetical protein
MKQITDTDWSDGQKVNYFADLVYAMNICCECEDIEISFAEAEGVYIKWCLEMMSGSDW